MSYGIHSDDRKNLSRVAGIMIVKLLFFAGADFFGIFC
jgi:hypothetical protein